MISTRQHPLNAPETTMKALQKTLHATRKALTRNFAPYFIVDEYGTKQYAWTFADAADWLAYCAPRALIGNLYTNRFVASRTY